MLVAADALAQLRARGFAALADAVPVTIAEAVMGAPTTHKAQPLRVVLQSVDRFSNAHGYRVLVNTNRAIQELSRVDIEERRRWLVEKIRAAGDLRDYANASSALAEVRALGWLIGTGADIQPVPPMRGRRTCDFRLAEGASEWFVEVHAKQMNAQEAAKLRQFYEGTGARREPLLDGATIREHLVQPAGERKADETVAENVASKFAAIKSDAGQAARGGTSVLWLDLQDQDWLFRVDDAEPVTLWRSEFTSVGLWHGVYGRKGTPLFEQNSIDRRIIDRVRRMSFDGMFAQAPAWSAAVLSFSDGMVLFENPSAEHPLTNELREKLLQLAGVDLGRSWIDWPPGARALADRIADERVRLEGLATRARYSW